MAIDYQALTPYLETNYFGNTGYELAHSLLLFIGLFIILKIFKVYGLKILHKFAKKSKNSIDDILIEFIDHINWFFYVYLSYYMASRPLALPGLAHHISNWIGLAALVYYGIKFVQTIIDVIAQKQIEKRQKEDKTDDASFISVIAKIVKAIVWVIALLMVLSNMGVNITSLIAGLGVGGIAIAFALQNVLEDLFSSFTIYFDKPFKVGDFIVIGADSGTVKHIGIKSTRIETLQGQELIVSNRELTNTRVNNYKRMEKRRIVNTIGVEYGTSLKQLKEINAIVGRIFKKVKNADLDRVHFKAFGDFSLIFEIVFYVKDSEYLTYMDTQQEINYEIKREFEKAGISMAFPTQTIHLKK
ncbi:mechanosensitive ion channel family protein [Candidatus Woesearchaeota archaeon]|nr:mechanosensitive ion channel family protein [Candidatus Woesearchaeota archaeon]